ncbi:pyridine nucleotide-disulfide oxidoreductase [Mycolicibacterium sp. CH28]|uniref:NAD(P)/FAD-dependent oxidoreductase n=1 Tax=Mycolicibacterium sp. CH28 TaxID=2512237 RepID=UPI0010818E67|nr:FAD-dependent oxidoreductase [Mycolicibacterium sp. CH28]TGD85416.1 pyridine nucleotide-disulfide oxidoreductase [Mycolicibacterium sp. CH28]
MTVGTFVTVGAGQAAAVAARTLRRRGFDGRIVLIGDEPHAPYQRPPLSKEFLSGAESVDSLWLLTERWLADNDVDIITGTTVARIDKASRTVVLDRGSEVSADAVLFATGAVPRRLPVAGPRPELVHVLRTIDDARRLQRALSGARRAVVIGGGFIGLEIAATATRLGLSVTVLEAGPLPLGAILGPRIAGLCTDLHRRNGVEVRTSVVVQTLRTTSDTVVVELADGTVLEADLAIVGVGVTPNVSAAAASGLAVDGGIVVDGQGRTSIPEVYAAGDVARRYSARLGRHVRSEHFDNANRQGAAVADAVLGRDAVADDPGWFWSDQYDHNIQLCGAASNVDPIIRGDVESMDFAAFYTDGGVLVGAFGIDRGEDVMAARELIGRTIEPGVLADQDVDLWTLYETEEVAS